MTRRAIQLCLIVVLLIGLPMLGVILAGKPIEPYLEFPPVTQHVEHAPFSWSTSIGLFLFIAVMVSPFLVMMMAAPPRGGMDLMRGRSLAWWGWLGLGILVLAWTLAWTRFTWFELLQPFTFTPLWIGYILVVNALTYRRTGHCMMLDRVGYFVSLFPLSAVLWWFFEYLNRFVQNWHYIGVSEFTPVEYFLHATLPFSTVLPAVLGTIECLESFPRLDSALRDRIPVEVPHGMALAWAVLGLSCAGLLGIGIWPDYLFPLVWVSPLLIITALQGVCGEETVFSGVARGDWRGVWLPSLAGLTCGFFWELWNSRSLAHWVYTVPYVHGWQIFEMPLLGYAGYLPFGLECWVVAGLLPGARAKTG